MQSVEMANLVVTRSVARGRGRGRGRGHGGGRGRAGRVGPAAVAQAQSSQGSTHEVSGDEAQSAFVGSVHTASASQSAELEGVYWDQEEPEVEAPVVAARGGERVRG